LTPVRSVMWKVTWPDRFQTRYWPPVNDDTVRLSSTEPVAASSTSTRSVRPPLSQSRK
ncbi:MAG TPA: hypothetical protein DDY78_12100, partial [Planctomycetales bacterium]|nr:hypothetical protein [Planctomycetales bacterium]